MTKSNKRSLIATFKQYVLTVRILLLKRKANKLTAKYRVPHYIVFLNGKITLITKDWFRENRQRKIFTKHFTANNLKKVALYYTTV